MNRFSERNQVTFIDENELQNNSNSNNEWEQCRGYDDDLQLVEYVENLKEKEEGFYSMPLVQFKEKAVENIFGVQPWSNSCEHRNREEE